MLCKKNIKLLVCLWYLVKMRLDFPTLPVISLEYGWLLNGASWELCSKVSGTVVKALACLRPVPPFPFCHVLPYLSNPSSQFHSSYMQKPCPVLFLHLQHSCCILILQVLCWYPDQQLQNWQGLELRPATVDKARPPMLLQHLKLAPALQPSQMHFSAGLKSKEEAEVQLVSRLCPPRLSPRLEGKCSVLGLLVGPLPWKGQQIKMTEDRAAGKLVSCTRSALWCGGLICILKLKKLLSHYSKC